MKKIIIGIFLTILPFYAYNASAEELRVAALDFIIRAAEVKGTGKYVDGIIKEEVMGKGRYTYVSEKDLLNRWFGDENYMGLETNYAVLLVLNRNDVATPRLYANQKLLHVDFIIMSGAETSGKDLVVNSMIAYVDNGRYSMVSDICTPNDINEIVRRHVKYLLGKGPALQKVEADKEIDAVNSIVAYDFISDDGKKFEIRVKYNGVRMEPEIDDVFIVPEDAPPNSMQTFRLKTREGKSIEFKGIYKRSRLTDVVSAAEPPDAKGEEITQEALSIVSHGGYVLNLALYWRGKELKATKVVPLVNPYGEIK